MREDKSARRMESRKELLKSYMWFVPARGPVEGTQGFQHPPPCFPGRKGTLSVDGK